MSEGAVRDRGRPAPQRRSPWHDAVPSAALIERYSKQGPRYTSYPAAPYWSGAYGAGAYRGALAGLGERAAAGQDVSLYVHVPFCEHRCTFCACNVVISRDHSAGARYIDLVTREMDLVLEAAGGARPRVVQMHWGGGTPTWLSAAELALLHDRIAERFDLLPGREQSVEVDPRVTSFEQLDALRDRGLNRVSMGVQDFTPEVQAAVHRVQSAEQTAALIGHARRIGIRGVNADLIYGLPHQTPVTFARTVDAVIGMGVDRVALYNFAHLPARLTHHKAILPEWLPSAAVRMELFRAALEKFAAAGYRTIGLDHFAKGTDELSVALDEGTIQRNFMGYTTRAGRDLVSFGVSAISRVGRDFVQNVKETGAYAAALGAGELPVERGMRLSDEDLVREALIQGVMCYGRVDLSRAVVGEGRPLLEADTELAGRLRALREDGLVELDGAEVRVTALGRSFLRNIAMVFDAYLKAPPPEQEVRGRMVQVQFSRTV